MTRLLHRLFKGETLGAAISRAAAGTGMVQVAGVGLTFLVGIILARGLGVEQLGVYGVAMAVLTIAAIPGEFGLPQLVVREVSRASGSDVPRLLAVVRWAKRTGLAVSLAVMVVVALATWAFLGSDDPTSQAIFLGLPIVILSAQARIRGAALQGLKHVALGFAPALLFRPLALFLLLALLFLLSPAADVRAVMAAQVIATLVAALLAMAWLARRLPGDGQQAGPSDPRWLGSAMTLGLSTSIFILQAQTGMIAVGALSSDTQAGLFRVAIASLAIVGLPMTVILNAVAPHLSALHGDGDRRRLQILATRAGQAQLAAVALVCLPFFLFAGPLLSLVFGADYAAAAPALLVMLVGQIFSAALGVNSTLLNMAKRERSLTVAMGAGLAVGIAVMLVLVPVWGAVGAAVGQAASLVVWNLLAWAATRAKIGVDTFALRRVQAPERHDSASGA